MATGTEGNDTIVVTETGPVQALGGDDVISVTTFPGPGPQFGQIDVDGGSGFDVLQVDLDFSWSSASVTENGSSFTFDSGSSFTRFFSYTNVESLIIEGRVDRGAGVYEFGATEDWLTFNYSFSPRTPRNLSISTGDGDDRVVINNVLAGPGIVFAEVNAGAGNDFVDLTMAAVAGSQFLVFGGDGDDVLIGSSEADRLDGGAGADSLTGGTGNDRLDGGSGLDMMDGGLGNDSYFVDAAGDLVVEASGGGFDIVYASGSYRLAAGVEIEVLGTVDNSATTELRLDGNELNNLLVGNAGRNLFVGRGGADDYIGYGGDDVYFVDADDRVFEDSGGGYDIVYTSTSYRLQPGTEIEILGTANNLGTEAIDLTGNELNNLLVGNQGRNVFVGGGGIDDFIGYGGDDVYFVDADDRAFEEAGGGNDTVYASASHQLLAGAEVEVLATANELGTDPIDLTGNEFDNQLVGNAGRNFLVAGGGADDLIGHGGDDAYFVDGLDRVFEDAGGGYDIVYASAIHRLQAGAEIEVLGTANNLASDPIDLTGNELNNLIVGNAGRNVLAGGGGKDYLRGEGGADLFRFESVADSVVGQPDTVLDFVRGADLIDLSGLDGNSRLDGRQSFQFIGTSAFTADPNRAVGQLRYEVVGNDTHVFADVNGDGLADFQLVLSSVNGLDPNAADFLL